MQLLEREAVALSASGRGPDGLQRLRVELGGLFKYEHQHDAPVGQRHELASTAFHEVHRRHKERGRPPAAAAAASGSSRHTQEEVLLLGKEEGAAEAAAAATRLRGSRGNPAKGSAIQFVVGDSAIERDQVAVEHTRVAERESRVDEVGVVEQGGVPEGGKLLLELTKEAVDGDASVPLHGPVVETIELVEDTEVAGVNGL
mmetsp:Transcript_86034/g.256663  ORF Transcript_86034/g.256663 Transcript_86034/m.256663 type:complete len:201 (-) Transcript_86034:325-927(-)